MRKRTALIGSIVFATTALVACGRTTVMPLAKDVYRVSASVAPACGPQGAERMAFQRAAVETIRGGFDKFIIVSGTSETNVGVLGYTPTIAQTSGLASANSVGNSTFVSGHTTTTFSGGHPIVGGTHDEGLVVKMFSALDPAGANALDARAVLGPEWMQTVAENKMTCF